MRFLTFQPLIPPPLWVLLSVVCAASWAWYASRRPVELPRARWSAITLLTACGIAAVLVVLLNPTWLERVPPPGGKPVVSVLVDASASMDTPDASPGTTRFEAASTLARGLAGALGAELEVRTAVFAESTRPVEPEALARIRPEGAATDLASAIESSLVEDRPAGQSIVLLSDGIHNAGGQAARVLESVRLARGLAAPIFTKTLGGAVEVRDLALDLESQQELTFIGQKAPLVARVRRRGVAVPEATLVVTHDGREVARRSIAFDAQGRAESRVDIEQPRPGLYRYEARVEPAPGEVIIVNNAESFLLRVVDEPVRVLLLEGKPYWDAKFLVRTLGSDPSIELDSVVRLAEGRFLRRTLLRPKTGNEAGKAPDTHAAAAGLPTAETITGGRRVDNWKILSGVSELLAGREALGRYQIIVLGREADVFLVDELIGRLRDWIARDSGALVCYRGAPAAQLSQPLARLLPVSWSRSRESRFRVELTERGRELRWLPRPETGAPGDVLGRLPMLARSEHPHEPKPLAVVLAHSTATAAAGADDGPAPVVTYQPYGSGRVVVIEGAGMWRWAFLPPQYRDDRDIYGGLWHSLIRWLASSSGIPPGQDRLLRADKIAFRTNEPATATLLLRDQTVRREVPKVVLEGSALNSARAFVPVAAGDEPGTFRVLFGTLPEGRYRARTDANGALPPASAAEIAFDVRGFADEQLDRDARPDLMTRIALESGGAVLASGSPAELINQLQAERSRSRMEQVLRYPAWDRWWVLTGIVAIWGTVWKLRRSAGLV